MTTNRDLFAKHVGLRHFVETGSCFGRSIQQAVELGYSDVRSVEAKPARYEHCLQLFLSNPNVRLWCGDSVKLLPEMVSDLNEPALLWLDSHPSGDDSYNCGSQSENLMAEMRAISNHHVKNHVILIDDLTPDIEKFAREFFPTAGFEVHNTDEGLAKVLEVVLRQPNHPPMLSQFGESEIIANYFGSFVGSFIDCGSAGGVALSNTFELGLRGWRGLFVEPSPIHFQNLLANYHHRGGFEFLNAALWTDRKLMKFNLNSGFLSSLIASDEPERYQARYHLRTVTADDLKAIQPEADFVSLDIEGADIEVFPSLVKVYPDARLFCVEHGGKPLLRIDWKEAFDKHGLEIIHESPENFIVKRK